MRLLVTGLSGTLLFSAGETVREFTLTIAGDATQEADETFTVALSTSSSNFAVNAGSAQNLVLRNDDTRFDLSAVGSTTVTEADPSSTPADVPVVFRVDRSGRLSAQQVVTWTVEGRGEDAASGNDFVTTTGTVTFAANAAGSQLFTVYVKGDLEGEANEGFQVTISGDGLQFGASSVTSNGQAPMAYFPAHIRLKQTGVRVEGRQVPVSAGMNVTAEIRTGQRTLLDYLLSPIQRTLDEAVRER